MNEQALKERLKYIAKSENKSFQEIWKLLLLERFLVRLSLSEYKINLIFKGGLLLSYYLNIARETSDVDLLLKKTHGDLDKIKTIFAEICNIKINDGFTIKLNEINELDHTHMNYPGYRIKLNASFGKMKDIIQVDTGVGDSVQPKQISWMLFQYKGKPIFDNFISLQAYPAETIFSEKIETITSRGATNSRMKDFHDILLMCRKSNLLDIETLNKNMKSTFENRNTQMTIPIKFSKNDYSRLQTLWLAHLRTLNNEIKLLLQLPDHISEVVKEINRWLVDSSN